MLWRVAAVLRTGVQVRQVLAVGVENAWIQLRRCIGCAEGWNQEGLQNG